jgi:hypothetical protein
VVDSKGTLGLSRWRGDGKELFYLSAEGEVMAVSVTTDPTFSHGVPRALFRVTPAFFSETNYPGTLAAVACDGERFLLAMPVAAAAPQELTVLVGWTTLIRPSP